ncbi:MAG: hypothetical protein AAF902_26850 [Chloroflexota bacterium]
MSEKSSDRLNAARGMNQLTVDAVLGVTNIVDSMHQTILSFGGRLGNREQTQTSGLTGIVYWGIRTITETVGNGLDQSLSQLGSLPIMQGGEPSSGREAVLSALNGVLGDHLQATENPLAISMKFRQAGKPLTDAELSKLLEQSNGKLAILIHGSCMNDLQWNRNDHDHGETLYRDLGYTPLYLHYNSGCHTSENGKQMAELLESLLALSTQKFDLAIVCHSMGGLVARSACYYGEKAGHAWLSHLTKLLFLGTPHHGAPLEKGGNWIDTILQISPYSTPFASLGKIRSSGVTDLRYGNIIDEDWRDIDRFEPADDPRTPVPLPKGVACYAIAATLSQDAGVIKDGLIGDGLVTVSSALGHHHDPVRQLKFPEAHCLIIRETNHLGLLDSPQVDKALKEWLI